MSKPDVGDRVRIVGGLLLARTPTMSGFVHDGEHGTLIATRGRVGKWYTVRLDNGTTVEVGAVRKVKS